MIKKGISESEKIIGEIYNIIISGVGGQGIVLIGNILREYGLKSPLIQNVVGTETRGVAQREGMVVATARYLIGGKGSSLKTGYSPEELISPLIPMNDAHLFLGLEPLETIRNLKYISKQTIVILNTHKHYPRNVIIGSEKEEKYPSNEKIINTLNQFAKKIISMDFNDLSEKKLKNTIYTNSIILGVGVKEIKDIFNKELMIELFKEFFKYDPKKNIEAFEMGYNLVY